MSKPASSRQRGFVAGYPKYLFGVILAGAPVAYVRADIEKGFRYLLSSFLADREASPYLKQVVNLQRLVRPERQ